MPQSLSAVYVHLIFSTKERRPFLQDTAFRASVHAYLGAVSRELDCPALLVGGVEDHVHILARLGRPITQSDWVKELKRVSNGWIKTQHADLQDFQWQAGYGDFSVSHSNIDSVLRYIADQAEHHRKQTFQDEYRAFLKKHAVEYDERYVWD